MQTAPATSQKTPKVANDDFVSIDEAPLGLGARQQDRWQRHYRSELDSERYLLGATGYQANSHQLTRTAHRPVIATKELRNVSGGL